MNEKRNILSLYEHCTLCPRACGVNRLAGQTGYCGQSNGLKLAYACLHRGEEPPLNAKAGSGALFFSGCTLKCISCQNYQLSQESMGREVTEIELADIMCCLQKNGACNINIVTGSHFIPGIINVIKQARNGGMQLPIVWNSSGYESPAALKLLARSVDIYLADVKTLDKTVAQKLCAAPDYPEHAERALLTMAAAKPLKGNNNILSQGVILRHLILPGKIHSTEQVLAWYKHKLDAKVLLSLMTQFSPVGLSRQTGTHTDMPCRKLTRIEYKKVMDLLDKYGIEDGFFQEPAQDDAWLPDFSTKNPFPRAYAKAIWHYSDGYAAAVKNARDE